MHGIDTGTGYDEVSILVLLDVALKDYEVEPSEFWRIVSILVLLDVALKELCCLYRSEFLDVVSILVLLDVALKVLYSV